MLNAPTSVFVSLTYKCNFQCKHCAVYSNKTTYIDLETESWLNFFSELAKLKIFRVRLSGGEPFMRKDIWELLEFIHSLPMRISINTNASLIDKDSATRISHYHKWDQLMVSLDGSSPRNHDPIRGEGTFEMVYRGTRNLAQFDLPLVFYCTVNRYNFRDLDGITQLAVDLGASAIKFNELLPEGRGLNHYRELSLTKKEWKDTLERLREIRDKYNIGVSGTILDQGDMFDAMADAAEGDNSNSSSNYLSGCGALVNECAVRPDGWIIPCDRLPELKAGHIHEERFGEIWRSSDVFTRFRKRREVLLSNLLECRDCLYQSMCTGGCPATPYVLYGSIATRDPLSCYRIYLGEESFNVP